MARKAVAILGYSWLFLAVFGYLQINLYYFPELLDNSASSSTGATVTLFNHLPPPSIHVPEPIKHLKYLKKDVLVDTVPVTFSFKAKTRKRIEKYPTDTDNGPTGDKSTPRLTEPTSSLVSDSMTILRSLFKYAKEIERRPNNRNVNVNNNLYSHRMLHQEKKSCLMTGEKFYDNQNRTVTVIKVKDGSEILGGYNPVEWRSDGSYGTTKDSIVFSFNNDDRIENYILNRVMNECYATDF
ncbi:hypothetical protein RhiirB3_530037 [Rhizophagus irregularis]|nr:hypothetical protein RhiirB3_528376 [Rhizophagus irregularis]PKY28717.1 hypothetical protein RhiirB3_530037 [Rhizophagus irregularis]